MAHTAIVAIDNDSECSFTYVFHIYYKKYNFNLFAIYH
jgi:hypothetical protein